MGLWEIVVIAVGLSMDAFAVSITLGLSAQKTGARELVLPGLYFGAFQAIMPTAGFFIGTYFAAKIQSLDHWIAFVLLAGIGGKMIADSFAKDTAAGADSGADAGAAGKGAKKAGGDPVGYAKMCVLALATSIDALTVGVTYAFFDVAIFRAAAITGVIAAALSVGGVKIGAVFGARYKSKAEFLGGAVLVLLGVKILVEHLLAGGAQ
jgi:putative Mn2+ efflux pump MntP